ncbi:hypothetical protein IscW_ISCW015554 [Ixodes scapularis]|uniref:Uncharacterized protein n=1 Tax=Ixodes scapularis TaxID=6945 RepID=B7P2Q7_IXOSC|nr:hypothetical protein IscW_ISCW015554 [Ixodes scapularis]|eukprot:XP_002402873.1 hypothetical protein IscW_ISCW015554 [Ixodes scapularis]
MLSATARVPPPLRALWRPQCHPATPVSAVGCQLGSSPTEVVRLFSEATSGRRYVGAEMASLPTRRSCRLRLERAFSVR